MEHSSTQSQSVARKLALLSLTGLAVVLLAVSLAIGALEQRSTHALMQTSVAERVQSLVGAADAADQTSREQVLSKFEKR